MKQTSFEKILTYIEQRGKITMLDGGKIGVTAITQRCNDMYRVPKLYERYLKGRRIVKNDTGKHVIYSAAYSHRYWPQCDVVSCKGVSCSQGMCWPKTGYWIVCPVHAREWRGGKPQPRMKRKAIKREQSRDEKGYLPIAPV